MKRKIAAILITGICLLTLASPTLGAPGLSNMPLSLVLTKHFTSVTPPPEDSPSITPTENTEKPTPTLDTPTTTPATPTPTPVSTSTATPTPTPTTTPTPTLTTTPTPTPTPTTTPAQESPTPTPVTASPTPGQETPVPSGSVTIPPEELPYVAITAPDITVKQIVIPDEQGNAASAPAQTENAEEAAGASQANSGSDAAAAGDYTALETGEANGKKDSARIEGETLSGEKFILYNYATAVDEANNSVPVDLFDDGGFDFYTVGEYTVTYMAIHPVTEENYFQECTITVKSAWLIEAEARVKDSSSNARYRKYAQYRNSIQDKLSEKIEALNAEFALRAQLIAEAFSEVSQVKIMREVAVEQDEGDNAEIFTLEEMEDAQIVNWSHVLPVFVAKSSMKLNKPLDLYNLRTLSLDGVDEVFFDMHDWIYIREEDTLTLILRERTSDEMIEFYGMDEMIVNRLDELMQPEFQMLFSVLTGDDTFIDMSEEKRKEIKSALPEGLTMQREAVVLTAYSLVGNMKYFWGGKYPEIGVHPLWGVERVVSSPNSETYGSIRPYGMDCSGFAQWVFVNAAKDEKIAELIGGGTSTQWGNTVSLGWDEAQPGDLAFFRPPGTKNHVGVVVEKREDGSYLVAHCSSAQNNVVVTEAWETGFRYMRRPILYEEE